MVIRAATEGHSAQPCSEVGNGITGWQPEGFTEDALHWGLRVLNGRLPVCRKLITHENIRWKLPVPVLTCNIETPPQIVWVPIIGNVYPEGLSKLRERIDLGGNG